MGIRRPPQGGVPVERVRDEHPDDPAWRADALAGSRHSRLLDELRMPLEDPDPERAAAICGEVARAALRDFAPALILLPEELRRRAQALAAWALTLFDFAGQSGLEGERLSQINRWEFELERALDGEPAGQPVFVRMAAEEAARPWPREALDRIAAAARQRVASPPAGDRERALAELEGLAAALGEALSGEPLDPRVATLGAAVLRLRGLLDLPHDLARGRARPEAWGLAAPPPGERIAESHLPEAIVAEANRLRPVLGRRSEAVAAAPADLRPAVRYLGRAGFRLLTRIERAGPAAWAEPPSLGAWTRIRLLLLARLAGR